MLNVLERLVAKLCAPSNYKKALTQVDCARSQPLPYRKERSIVMISSSVNVLMFASSTKAKRCILNIYMVIDSITTANIRPGELALSLITASQIIRT